MRVRYFKCGYPTSLRAHLRSPWIHWKAICGQPRESNRTGWIMTDYAINQPPCRKCEKARASSTVRIPKSWLPVVRLAERGEDA